MATVGVKGLNVTLCVFSLLWTYSKNSFDSVMLVSSFCIFAAISVSGLYAGSTIMSWVLQYRVLHAWQERTSPSTATSSI